jgi:hypothetical protein
VITPVVLPGAEHMAAPTSRPMLHQRKKAWLAPMTAYGALNGYTLEASQFQRVRRDWVPSSSYLAAIR